MDLNLLILQWYVYHIGVLGRVFVVDPVETYIIEHLNLKLNIPTIFRIAEMKDRMFYVVLLHEQMQNVSRSIPVTDAS